MNVTNTLHRGCTDRISALGAETTLFETLCDHGIVEDGRGRLETPQVSATWRGMPGSLEPLDVSEVEVLRADPQMLTLVGQVWDEPLLLRERMGTLVERIAVVCATVLTALNVEGWEHVVGGWEGREEDGERGVGWRGGWEDGGGIEGWALASKTAECRELLRRGGLVLWLENEPRAIPVPPKEKGQKQIGRIHKCKSIWTTRGETAGRTPRMQGEGKHYKEYSSDVTDQKLANQGCVRGGARTDERQRKKGRSGEGQKELKQIKAGRTGVNDTATEQDPVRKKNFPKKVEHHFKKMVI